MPTDLKQFIGAIALIRRTADGEAGDEWLAQWNPGRGCYHFVEAHRIEGESYRESLQREIEWATGLRRGKDYLVSGAPRAHLQFAEADSCRADAVWFLVEFYLVELMGGQHHQTLAEQPNLVWLSAAQVQSGTAADGRPLCGRLRSLLRQADILAPWQG